MIMRLASIFVVDPAKFKAKQERVDELTLRDLLVLSLVSFNNKMGDDID